MLGTTPWTSEAHTLLNKIGDLDNEKPTMLFLRHSQREEIDNWASVDKLLLTDEGIDAAKEFGSRLPRKKIYRLYFSPVERCGQTAEYIKQGIERNDGKIEDFQELPILKYPGDSFTTSDLFRRDSRQFMNYWAANHYSIEKIELLSTYAYRSAKVLWPLHKTCSPKGCDLFITHDTNILGNEFGWCGYLRDTYSGWVEFLGGFLLQLNKNQLLLHSQQRTFSNYLPHWVDFM